MASAAALLAAREWVGSSPDDPTLGAALDAAQGRVAEIARQILGARLADLLSQPATFAVAGAVSVSSSANITALRERLADLAPLVAQERAAAGLPPLDGTAVVVSRVTRSDQSRLPTFGGGLGRHAF